ncbi:hypothetical protein [Shimia biformata]|uniref:hypothetical protein n=1 Tax=Shimia biformata TaxID=1294299 RepID=UPI00194ED3DA|nr:hypothetical protein [Shimia biformata]
MKPVPAQLSRRDLLTTAAAFAAMSAMPTLASSKIAFDNGAKLTTVSDGHLILPRSMIFGDMPQAELDAILLRHGAG